MKKIIPLLTLLILASCQGNPPSTLGLYDSKFKKCNDKPNCISTFSKLDSPHYIEPINYQEPKNIAIKKVLKIIELNPKSKVIRNENDYLLIEVTSDIFRFVDDLEFYFGIPGKIHMKSASRIGHSDLGVNKKRLGEIIFKYHQSGSK